MQRRLVFTYIIFGTIYRPRLRRSRVFVVREDGTYRFSRNVSTYLPIYAVLRNIAETPSLESRSTFKAFSSLTELDVLKAYLEKKHTIIFLHI